MAAVQHEKPPTFDVKIIAGKKVIIWDKGMPSKDQNFFNSLNIKIKSKRSQKLRSNLLMEISKETPTTTMGLGFLLFWMAAKPL